MSTPNILRRYMDILAERVTMNPDGTTSGGFKPNPVDPNAPVDPRHQAMQQAKDQADQAYNAWVVTRPKTADGRLMPANLNPAAVERVLAGEDPNTVIKGRSQLGAFGTDPSQYKTLAQQYLAWLAKQPAKFDNMDPKWDSPPPAAAAPAPAGAININVQGTQQAAKLKAYNDAKAAGATEEQAQNAEAAAGNLAGAEALSKVDINDPSTYVNNPRSNTGPSSEAERQQWIQDPTKTATATAPAAAPAKAPYKGSAGAQEIQKLNPAIIDVNRIQVGQKLKMPNGQPDYIVKPGDTLDRIAKGVKPAQGAMSANVAPVGQPAATAANPALGTIKGATQAIPTVAPPAGNPSGVGKNATYTTDEIAAAREALKDPKLGARDRAFYTGMLANQPKAVKENTGYDEVERIVSLVHYR